jgi:hypothetical protein
VHWGQLVFRQAGLVTELRRPPVVLGKQVCDLVSAVAGTLLEEVADLEVLPAADRLRQHPVGDVADQHVLERHLVLFAEAVCAAGQRHQDVLLVQRRKHLGQVGARLLRDRGERALPERLADDRRLLHDLALDRVERVQARGQQRVDGVGQRPGRLGALLTQAADHLLGEERVTAGALGDELDHGRDVGALGHQRRDQLAGLVGRQRLEEDRRRGTAAAAPVRPALEQLVTRQAQDQERRAHPARQVLDQVEHSVVGPMDVFEDEHGRPLPGTRLDAEADRREERLAQPLGVLRLELRRLRGRLDRDQAADQCRHPLRLEAGLVGRHVAQVLHVAAELAPGVVGRVGVDDRRLAAHDLAERPVDHARAVRQAVAHAQRRRAVVRRQPQLGLAQQARLADPRLPDHRDQVSARLPDDAPVERVE